MDLPPAICVRGSGQSNLDGTYVRANDVLHEDRDKPYYVMRKEEQKVKMYLYWLNEKWKLGCKLDSSKSFGFSKDEPGKKNPCNPNRCWMLWDQQAKEFKPAPSSMLVRWVDAAEGTSDTKEVGVSEKQEDLMETETMTSHVPSDVSMAFENKMRELLSSLADAEQQQKKLDMAMKRLNSRKPTPGSLPPELAQKIIERLQLDFGTGSPAEGASKTSPSSSPSGSPKLGPASPSTSPKKRKKPPEPSTPPTEHSLPASKPKLSGFW